MSLWSRLSVFSGGLELDAAEQVCADETLPADTILDLIASLVDKSVITRTGDGPRARYKMLEVVREYGAARLAGGRRAARRSRAGTASGSPRLAAYGDAHWASPDQAALMLRLRDEQANLRVALEYAVTEGTTGGRPAVRRRPGEPLVRPGLPVRGPALAGPGAGHAGAAALDPGQGAAGGGAGSPACRATGRGAEALLADARALAESLPPSVGAGVPRR